MTSIKRISALKVRIRFCPVEETTGADEPGTGTTRTVFNSCKDELGPDK